MEENNMIDPDYECQEDQEEIYRRIGDMEPEEFHPEDPILCSLEAVPNIQELWC